MVKKSHKTMLLVWPLLIGMFMIMVGNGLQGTLLSLRADMGGFTLTTIGIIMSMYYVGYLGGWFIVPNMIKSVGHIRVFAGFASMASTTILIQGLFVDPYLWSIVRLLGGISFVGLFIVAESWLNNIAPNKSRGQILSNYIFVINGGLFGGQFLINFGPIDTMGLFVLVSVLISLSLLPVTFASKAAPVFEDVENLPFKKLLKTSPLSVLCVFICGFINACVLTMGPVYGQAIGFKITQISFLMATFVLGCAALPPIAGWVSDLIDRRKAIIATTFLGTIFSVWVSFDNSWIYLCAFAVGGFSTATYSVGAAMMNDRLKPSQMTSATASLILINGIGACISPIMLGTLMEVWGTQVFFPAFGIIFMIAFIYGTYRNFAGPEIDIDKQGDFQSMPPRSSPSLAVIGEED